MSERSEQSSGVLSFRCPRDLSRAVEVAAAKQLLSKSDYVRLATLSALKADGVPLELAG